MWWPLCLKKVAASCFMIVLMMVSSQSRWLYPRFLVCPTQPITYSWKCRYLDLIETDPLNRLHHLFVEVWNISFSLKFLGLGCLSSIMPRNGSIKWNPTKTLIVHLKWTRGHGHNYLRSLLTSFWRFLSLSKCFVELSKMSMHFSEARHCNPNFPSLISIASFLCPLRVSPERPPFSEKS